MSLPRFTFHYVLYALFVVDLVIGVLVGIRIRQIHTAPTPVKVWVHTRRPSDTIPEELPRIIEHALPAATQSATPSAKKKLALNPAGFCFTVPILIYHHIEPDTQAQITGQTSIALNVQTFDDQMQYLKKNGYHFYTAEDVVIALKSHKPLLGKPIVITFDDSYQDFYTNAFPVLKKYAVMTSLFFITGHAEGPDPGYMSWAELKEVTDSGIVVAYDHTWSHPNLAISDDQKVLFEIITAKKQLEEK